MTDQKPKRQVLNKQATELDSEFRII